MSTITCVHCGLEQTSKATICGLCGKPFVGTVVTISASPTPTPRSTPAQGNSFPVQQLNKPVQICPVCNQPKVYETTTSGFNVALWIVGLFFALGFIPGVFIAACFAVVLLLIGVVLMSIAHGKKSTFRQCHHCGHKWLVG